MAKKTQETQSGEYKFRISQSPEDVTFRISTSEETEGIHIDIKWDKIKKRLSLNCGSKDENENFDIDVTFDRLERELILKYGSKDESGKVTGSGTMSMSIPPGNRFALEGEGTFPLESEMYAKTVEESPLASIPEIPEEVTIPTPPKKFEPHELEPYIGFKKSTKYALTLESLISSGVIKNEDIYANFRDGNERRRVKQTLIHLSKNPEKPLEKLDGDYKVNDLYVFQKILKAAELKKESQIATVSEAEIPLTDSVKKYIQRMKEVGLLSPTKTTVTYEEVDKIFNREEKIGLANSLRTLEHEGYLKIKGKDKQREYIFKPSIINIEISPEEIIYHKPVPLGGKKFIEHALALKEITSGEPSSVSESDFERFFEERFGRNKGSKAVGGLLKKRLLGEGYIRKTDDTYILTRKFSELSEFLRLSQY